MGESPPTWFGGLSKDLLEQVMAWQWRNLTKKGILFPEKHLVPRIHILPEQLRAV